MFYSLIFNLKEHTRGDLTIGSQLFRTKLFNNDYKLKQVNTLASDIIYNYNLPLR